MLNLREVEEAIRDLQSGSATYNNCMKLASLYIVRDQMRKKDMSMGGYGQYNYTRPYYPMYERGGRGGGSSSYGYRQPMYYTNDDDLMIRKDRMGMYDDQGQQRG